MRSRSVEHQIALRQPFLPQLRSHHESGVRDRSYWRIGLIAGASVGKNKPVPADVPGS
jgi:hypothetical protein